MLQKLTPTLSRLFLLGFLLALGLGINYLQAWTAPTQAPPNGNVNAPLNTGSTLQGKSGGLTLGSTLDIGSSLSVGGVPSDGPYLIDMDAATPSTYAGIRFPDGTVQTSAASSSSAGGLIVSSGLIPGGSNATILSDFGVVFVTGTYNDGDSSVIQGYVTNQSGVMKGYGIVAGNRMNEATLTTTETCSNGTNTTNNLCYRKDASGNLIVRPGSSGSAHTLHYVALRGSGSDAGEESDGGICPSMVPNKSFPTPMILRCGTASSMGVFYFNGANSSNISYKDTQTSGACSINYNATTGAYVNAGCGIAANCQQSLTTISTDSLNSSCGS